jgi:hypothetical protein
MECCLELVVALEPCYFLHALWFRISTGGEKHSSFLRKESKNDKDNEFFVASGSPLTSQKLSFWRE